MRDITFKGKNSKTWYSGYHKIQFSTNGNEKHIIYDKNFSQEVDPKTIGQFTGAVDSKDEKIYEGDILYKNISDTNVEIVVKWNEQKMRFELVYRNDVFFAEFTRGKVKTWKIIGNVND